MLAGTFGAWEVYGSQSTSALGGLGGNLAFVGGVLLLVCAVSSYGLLGHELQRLGFALGAGGGTLGIAGALVHWVRLEGSAGWGLYLAIFAGALAWAGASKLKRREEPAIPRGLSGA